MTRHVPLYRLVGEYVSAVVSRDEVKQSAYADQLDGALMEGVTTLEELDRIADQIIGESFSEYVQEKEA